MTARQFKALAKATKTAHRWEEERNDFMLCIPIEHIAVFVEFLAPNILADAGLACRLKEKHVAIWASEIFDDLDISPDDVFDK